MPTRITFGPIPIPVQASLTLEPKPARIVDDTVSRYMTRHQAY